MSGLQSSGKTRQGSKHDRTGCLTCRKRHKKCMPNTYPTCGNCARLNLTCIRESSRNVLTDDQRHAGARTGRHTAAGIAHVRGAELRSVVLPELSSSPVNQSRAAMQYYITVLSQHLTVSNEHNSFLSVYLPLAIESPALCDSIRAWALSHLSLVDQSYDYIAAETRLKAIRAVSAALIEPNAHTQNYETNAAACLVLLSTDIGHGDFASWYNHLTGARDIILSACGQQGTGLEAFKSTSEGRWLLRNFAYHDIIGSVTRGQPPLLEGHYLKGITNVVDSYLGVASEVLVYISDISQIAGNPLRGACLADRVNAQSRFGRLERELMEWKYSSDAPLDLASVAEAYRGSALVLLYQVWRRSFTPRDEMHHSSAAEQTVLQEKIEREVEATLTAVEGIPVGAAAESALLFPLFIVGCEVMDSDRIGKVRARLHATFDKRQFRNITQALELLEEIWSRDHIEQGSHVDSYLDWEELLQSSGTKLLLT